MFLGKSAGFLSRHAKMITCIALAISIIVATFVTIPIATKATDNEDVAAKNTQAAIFIGKVGAGKIATAFIPVDIADAAGESNLYSGVTYFKLTFACRMLSGSKPTVGVMRIRKEGDPSGNDRTYCEPSWCDNAASVSVADGVCTAYFKVDFVNRAGTADGGKRSFYITVGNAEHNGGAASEKDYAASFIMSDAVLVTCDDSKNVIDETNRLPAFTAENINFSGTYFIRSDGCDQYDSPYFADAMKWHVDSCPAYVKSITVPKYFNTSSDYEAANFSLHAETDTIREYYTNPKYEGLYFEKLANSDNKGFAVISDDLNKKFVFLNANHQGEADNTTEDGYKPQKNKAANIFIPLSLGQYLINDGSTTNQKVLVKVTFKATRIEGDGPPVLGRLVGMKTTTEGKGSRAWGLSTINVRGSAYYISYDRSDNGGGVRPQCTYNAETGEFVGWVGMETANNDLATLWGSNEVLTIGNAEHVYQTGTFDSTSFNSAFAISNIKVDLYSTTIDGNNITADKLLAEDIAPRLYDDTVDVAGEWYYDHKDSIKGSSHDKDLIRATQEKWHIDGEKSLLSIVDIADIKGYDRKYSLTEKGGKGVLSAYVSLEAGTTYQYVFKSKYESSQKAKPFVEFVTASGTKKVDASNYISNKGEFYNTVYVFKTPSNLSSGKNVRIGIDFASGDISGTFGGFELFKIGTDGMAVTGKNVMQTVFIGKNDDIVAYSADLDIGVWSKDGTLGSTGTTFEKAYLEDAFYALPGEPKMIMFSGTNTSPDNDSAEYKGRDGKLQQDVRIENDKRYRFTANVKYGGTGMPGDKYGFILCYYNKSGSKKTLVEFPDDGKYTINYEFDSPKSLLKSGANFSVIFSAPNAFVSGYIANISLVEIDADGNVLGDELIVNGSFATGDTTGFTRSGSFNVFKFCSIPDNFFTKNPGNNIHAIQYSGTGDYTLLQQMLQIKPNTRYEVEYTTLVTGYTTGEPYGVLYVKLWDDEEKTDSRWTYLQDTEKNPDLTDPDVITTTEVLNKKALGDNFDSSEIKDHAIRVKKVFTTNNRLRVDTTDNLSVRFYFMTGSSGYISDFTVYEIDKNGKRISNNIIPDGDFSSGVEFFNSSTPWKYPNEGTVRNIELEKGFFENYAIPATMMRSNGLASNLTYGNQLYVDPTSRYYFSGNYVKTNFVGLTPQVLYRSVSAGGEYVSIPFELYFDSARYYFTTAGGFTIPDDALINNNGKADIIVRLNNLDHGKGYFSNLSLTQDSSSKNLFSNDEKVVNKVAPNKFTSMDYDPEIFLPFEGDDGFEDYDWSDERKTYGITTGAITGRVFDGDGIVCSGVKMLLAPGNKVVYTDQNGNYTFDNLKPGNYSLYLVESSGYKIYCCDINVEVSVMTTLPDIYYDTNLDDVSDDTGVVDFDDNTTVKTKKYGALKGYCYSADGKLLANIDIYAGSKKMHVKTDKKGMFEFEKLPPGKYKICTILDDGSVYVFTTVKIEAGRGLIIKVKMPSDNTFPVWAIILIIAGGAVVLAGISLTTVILILKRRKKVKEAANNLQTAPQEVSE